MLRGDGALVANGSADQGHTTVISRSDGAFVDDLARRSA